MVGSIVVAIVVLSILILIHEFGHFIVAKRSGVWVEEFGIGIPPRLIGKKIGDTIYSINLLPFGGFVRLHGENSEDEIFKPKKAFLNKSKKSRLAITIAGVVMNFLLGVLCFSIVYSFTGIPKDTHQVKIVEVVDKSPAKSAGLVVGDVVESVDKQKVDSIDSFTSLVDQHLGQKVVLGVLRDGKDINITVVPRKDAPQGEGPLGIVITSTEIYYPPLYQRPFYGIYYGFGDAFYWGKSVLLGFGTIFSQLFIGKVPQGVAGPVGIFAITAEASKVGVLAVINFMGILSINFAILNVLPFPALDGGRILFIAIEAITRKKVPAKTEAAIHAAGMIILIALILLLTSHDIKTLIKGGLGGFLQP